MGWIVGCIDGAAEGPTGLMDGLAVLDGCADGLEGLVVGNREGPAVRSRKLSRRTLLLPESAITIWPALSTIRASGELKPDLHASEISPPKYEPAPIPEIEAMVPVSSMILRM